MASQRALEKLGFTGASGASVAPVQTTPSPMTTSFRQPVTTTPTPVKTTGYNPVQTLQSNLNQAGNVVKRTATAGLGWIGKNMQRPSMAFGTGLKNTYESNAQTKDITKAPAAALKGFKTGWNLEEGAVTPGGYVTDTLLKDKIKNPYAKAGIEFATDIVSDPLNYVGMGLFSKGNKAFQGSKIGTKIMPVIEAVGKSKPVEAVKDTLGALKYGYGLTPRTLKKYEALQTSLSGAGKYAADIARPLKYAADGTELPKETQQLLGLAKQIMENSTGAPLEPGEMKILQAAEPVLKKLFGQFEDLARQAIKNGADPAIFEETLGKYGGRRMFTSVASKGNRTGKIAVDMTQYMKRKNMSPEMLKKLGEVVEPAYGAATAAYSQKRNVEILKFFKEIAKENAISKQGFKALDAAEQAKYVLLPRGGQYGVLSNTYIPKKLYSYINPLVSSGPKTKLGQAFETFTKIWKPMKTVMSPAQLGRNTITSQIQAFLENPKSLMALPQAIKENLTKGKFFKALEGTGEITRTSPGIELQQFVPDEIAKLANTPGNVLSRIWELMKKPGSAVQNANEVTAKLQSFIARLSEKAAEAGITVDQALERRDLIEIARKSAESAGFNYQKVSPFVSKLRKGPVPFITYPLKAAELTGKTMIRNPERIAALQKAEQAAMNITSENAPNEKYLPSYLNQAVRIGKPDEKGSSSYLNTKYLYPWGNLTDVASGEGGFNPWTNIGISPNPIVSEAYTQLASKDIFGTSVKGKRIRHLAETLGPSFVRTAGKMADVAGPFRKNVTSSIAMKPGELALKEVGIPYYKYNPEQGAEWASYDKSQRIAEVRKAMKAYVRDYQGIKSDEEISRKLDEYYKQLEQISAE